MASIVYERNVGGGGELFSGIKFFILQRVPMRQTYMEAITRNGGEVVKIDKQANIIIADHARKDCPTGSISWTFIDKSVTRGQLEDIEKHRAGPTTHTVRDVGSAQPARSGRTPFTAQDDHDLMIWVTKAERNGISVKGNETFKQLEAINPRHTFQSWRDRWIKQLSGRPRPELSEEDISAQVGNPAGHRNSNHLPPTKPHRPPTPDDEVIELDSPTSIKQEPETQPLSSVSRPTIAIPKPRASTSTLQPAANKPKDKPVAAQPTSIVPLVRKSIGGMTFTEEEIDYMIENYKIMADADQNRGVSAWAKFAVQNPNHSAQEWHNYFVQTIKPLVQNRLQKLNTVEAAPEENQSPSNATEASASKQAHSRSSADVDDEVDADTTGKRFVDPSTKDESLFIEDLTGMAEENKLEVNFEPIICGRRTPLFRLWQVVNLDEFGGYDEVEGRGLWSQVARKLNFSDFKHGGAPEAIRSAYKEVLPDFEALREEYLVSLQEEAMIKSQLHATADRDSMEEGLVDKELEVVPEEDDYDDDLEAPASVPRQPHVSSSSKRSFDSDRRINPDGSPLLGTYNKRQRIDKGKGREAEIPSTPEDVINANQTPRPTYRSSPLKHQQPVAEEDSGSDELSLWPVKKPNFLIKRQAQHNLEPETQDFNFAAADSDADSQSSLPSLPNRQKGESVAIPAARSSPHEDFTTQSQTASQKEEELRAFIDQHIALGYRQEVVIEALESTNMTTGNAAIVMEALSQGNGIPEDIQGVWTAIDDVALDDVESEEFERVAMKHGTKSVALRQKFLEQQREVRRELGRE